jgi:hypothetical protein
VRRPLGFGNNRDMLQNAAQTMTHAGMCTTQLYDWRRLKFRVDEVERMSA